MAIAFVLFSMSNPGSEAVLQKFNPLQKDNYYVVHNLQPWITWMDYLK